MGITVLYSFDIFDTIITRRTATPQGIFALMQERIKEDTRFESLSSRIADNFAYFRRNAESMARRSFITMGVQDITLEQIYLALETTGEISHEVSKLLMELEIDTEFECIVPIPENIDLVRKLIREGKRVILISDMYHSEESIRRFVAKVDKEIARLPIYVSSEYKKDKTGQILFYLVGERENIAFSDWIHTGDNHEADILAPARLGINSIKYEAEKLMPIEKSILGMKWTDAAVQLLIGTARNVRINNKYGTAGRIGAGITGPILFSYVDWLLKRSIEMGILRLYFIARDGYLPKKIADIIIEKKKYDIETKYIYGSRKAWRMASFSRRNGDIKSFFKWSYSERMRKLSDIASMFQIDDKELLEFLPVPIKEEGKSGLRDIIYMLDNKAFKEFLIKKHSDKREMVRKYLMQEIDTSDDRFAFVEFLGSGFTQICLADIMSSFYDEPIKTFFYNMDSVNNADNCIFYNYFPAKISWLHLIEALNRAPHGQTSGYIWNNGFVEPVIEEHENEIINQYDISGYIDGIEKFASEYVEASKTPGYRKADVGLILEYMRYISETPDKELQDFIGDMPFGVTGREQKPVTFAPKLSDEDIEKIFGKYMDDDTAEAEYHGTSLDFAQKRCTPIQLEKILRYKERGLESRYRHPVPYKLLGNKIVIYAAGFMGQEYYGQLNASDGHQVVLWVDKNWKRYSNEGLSVVSPDRMRDLDYDTVLVAVYSDDLAGMIRNDLIKLGVPEEKIVTALGDHEPLSI